MAPRGRYPAPRPYLFTAEHREKYNGRWWRAPRTLGEAGTLAALWRQDGTKRGGGIASSVLPVLALHTWPGKASAHAAAAGLHPEPGWTGWTFLPRRRIARLAGIGKDAATAALRQLEAAGLLDVRRVPRAKYEGGFRTYYRLSSRLYAPEGEAYAAIPGALIYNGLWSMLPTNAARHVFLVLACLDPIGDEAAYLEKIRTAGDGAEPWKDEAIPADWWDRYTAEDIAELQRLRFLGRYRRPWSLRELEEATGVHRSTLREALHVLTVPVFGNQPRKDGKRHYPPIYPIARGEHNPTWYAPDRRAWSWSWKLDFLNDPERVRARQGELWPTADGRRERKRANEAAALVRSVARIELTPWKEAQALAELRQLEKTNGRPASGEALARLTGRNAIDMRTSLVIADNITPAVLERAAISDYDLNRLARTALYDAARGATVVVRAGVLRNAVEAARFTSRPYPR